MFEKLVKGDTFADRDVSAFPISIATSLALESLFAPRQTPYDPMREIPQHIDISKYQECWINVGTLFRNLVGAATKKAFLDSSVIELKNLLHMEIEIINSLFSNEGNNLCKPRYYFCTYNHVHQHTHKSIQFRTDKTDWQKIYRVRLDQTLAALHKETDEIFKFDSEVKPPSKLDALILTHVPYDLLSYKNFHTLSLLESNTGKLKLRQQWNSKYYPVPDANMSILPFERKLLLIFGDKTLIQPNELKLRKLILEIAVKRKWTPMTTIEKVILDFSIDCKEPFVIKFFKDL